MSHKKIAGIAVVIAAVFFTIIICYPMIFNPQQRRALPEPVAGPAAAPVTSPAVAQ